MKTRFSQGKARFLEAVESDLPSRSPSQRSRVSRSSLMALGHELSQAPDANRILAELSLSALTNNYRSIAEQVKGLAILPMVKANAYGHDLSWVCETLSNESNLYGFGVATLEEGERVRRTLGPRKHKLPIIVFSGATPWSIEAEDFCASYGLTPVIGSHESWNEFVKLKSSKRLGYEIKFNTGMNRLGIPFELATQVLSQIQKLEMPAPHGVLSHLACAEEPDHSVSHQQLKRFRVLRREVLSRFSQSFLHLGNSAAIWKAKQWELTELTDVVRPGLALYGIVPFAGAPRRGLEPVLRLKARVLTVGKLKAGESIGYGAQFKHSSGATAPLPYAIIGAGYADGVLRSLSSVGQVRVVSERAGGKKLGQTTEFNGRILGRVSMDMIAVECSKTTQPGDWAELIGPELDLWAQAALAGTIPYELLTSLSIRVPRNYVASF